MVGRRKKESPEVHRERIADAAEVLFRAAGTRSTSMDEIAKAAGYSKTTLYAYFADKDDIVRMIVKRAMYAVRDRVLHALAHHSDPEAGFRALCEAIVHFHDEEPLYFALSLDRIGRQDENAEAYDAGEQINDALLGYLQRGISQGIFRPQTSPLAAVFSVWGMLSGLVRLAAEKTEYVEQRMELDRDAFLSQGFAMVFRALTVSQDEACSRKGAIWQSGQKNQRAEKPESL